MSRPALFRNLIADVAKKVLQGRRTVLAPEQVGVNCAERFVNLSFENSVYVKITEGCSNHCAFCAIPLIRGELRSRPSQDVLAEIKSLLRRGIFEINLVGQDLAAYGTEKTFARGKEKTRSPLYSLLEKISALKGNFWVRLLYIHPDHFPLDILELLKKDSRLLAYFDIPFQSGDDEIIRAMNRKSTQKDYVELVHKIRDALPNAFGFFERDSRGLGGRVLLQQRGRHSGREDEKSRAEKNRRRSPKNSAFRAGKNRGGQSRAPNQK